MLYQNISLVEILVKPLSANPSKWSLRKTTDDEKHGEQKTSRLLINCEKMIGETLDNKDHENNVCVNPPPIIENRTDNADNKTSTNRNTSTKTSN